MTKIKTPKLVVYHGHNEVLVATKDSEYLLIKDYFTEGGRDLDDYDREELVNYVEVTTRLSVV